MARPRANNKPLPTPENRLARVGIRELESNPDLVEGGDCNPRKVWANLTKYGFVSPRREYVESINEPSFKDLAEKWRISEVTLYKWKSDQGWVLERARWIAGVLERQQEVMKSDLGEYQASELATRIGMWQSLRAMLQAVASKGYIEDPSPLGGVTQREFSPKDLKDMAAVMEKIDQGIGDAIGLSKAVLRKAENEKSEDTMYSVKEIVYRVTEAKQDDKDAPKPLPAPEPFVDGEVTEEN